MERDPKRTTRPLSKPQNPAHPLPPHWSMPLPKSQNPGHPLPLPWSMLLPQSQNPAHPLPLPWSMALHKSQNPAIPLLSVARSMSQVAKDLHHKASKGDKVCAVFTHHLRTGDKGYLHWGKVFAWRALSAQSSGRLIRKRVLIQLQMCFLLRQLHGLLFIPPPPPPCQWTSHANGPPLSKEETWPPLLMAPPC